MSTAFGQETLVGTVADETKTESENTLPNPTPPDGGGRAWSVLLGVWITQFVTLGCSNSYGVYNDFYVRVYLKDSFTSSQISWIGSVQLLLVFASGLFAGRAFDAGHFYLLMIGGSFLLVFSLFMLSLTHPGQYYQIFLSQGLGAGIAMGITYIPGIAVLSHWFHRRRALAMGIATTGSALGGALQPIMLNKLFHGPVGFHTGVRANAALNFGLLVIALLLMKPKPEMVSRNQGSLRRELRVFMTDPPYVIMVMGLILLSMGFYFPAFFLQLNAIKNGVAPGFAFYTLVILNGTSIVGRAFPNIFAASIGVFTMIIPATAGCGILILSTAAIKDVAGTMTLAVLYGFFSGAYAGLLAPMVGSLAKEDSEIGSRIGICFTFAGFGALIGAPIAGALLTPAFLWWRPILFSGLSVLTGCFLLAVSRFLVSRKRGTPWV
ncbi:major facilitator superfamily domain-containing protein [Collybia nuda]|uniref:Major facilitator superfamily domain-containing protein n=1 Tax=Collybia nuda TaxID=64659 RepID=A0A9P5XZ09_9AGAR|nr:major facilitator superfamily domain-containing protein [Collybia nuda]